MAISRWAWAAFNALQLVFTLLWTAGWICVALLVLLVARRRALPLRMAARCWAPGLLRGSGETMPSASILAEANTIPTQPSP
jgi:1-acyl-sn-glycerol-3-phosphate acyltransferase